MSTRSTHAGVVVGVDGSASSLLAVRWAAHAALMRNIELTVVHISSPPTAWPGADIPVEFSQGRRQAAHKILADATAVAQDTVPSGSRLKIDSELLIAAPGPTLVELSKNARMMVVGGHGPGTTQHPLLGSASNALVRHARCPVAVIHDNPPIVLQSRLPVLVGIDSSPTAALATEIAYEEASLRGVALIVLHACTDADTTAMSNMDMSSLRSAADEALTKRLVGFTDRYPDVIAQRRIVFGDPVLHLLSEAECAQLVVVGSRGRGAVTEMLLGSVSSAVVRAARIPVIVARQANQTKAEDVPDLIA